MSLPGLSGLPQEKKKDFSGRNPSSMLLIVRERVQGESTIDNPGIAFISGDF
jgi:hypothetical protein